MKQCPKCNSFMKFNMDYFCGNPVIYYTCISCGYDKREYHQYTISTTKTDSYLENKLSDVDIRGFAINSEEELLTNQNFEQMCEDKTDTTIYSFNKLISLLTNCNTNTIEILGLKDEHYIYLNDIDKTLLDNKDIFLSKNAIRSFGGYANQQLQRLYI